MKRCSRCILPNTIPNIQFDANGVCNHCIEFERNSKPFNFDSEKRIKRFVEIINATKAKSLKKGSKYDVLVPISGGRDSSYVAWKLATEYKMRVVCINYANPYSSEQAIKNIETLVKAINAKLIRFSYPHRVHERSFAANLKAWSKKPDLGTLGLICLACKPMYMEFYKAAHKEKIDLIVDGANIFEVTTFKMEAQGGAGTKSLLSLKTFSKVFSKAAKNLEYIKFCNILPAIRTFLSLNGTTPFLKSRYPNIIKLGYFYFFPYNEMEINETLRNIGWKKADDNNSPWRFDCEVDSIKNYIYQRTISATEKDDLFSKYIREGIMTREEALKRLSEGEVNPETVEKILGAIGLKSSQLDEACAKLKGNK